MKNTTVFILLATSLVGCYASHELEAVDECIDECEMVANRCNFDETSFFVLGECIERCEETSSSVVLFPDCADCFVEQARCDEHLILEFCAPKCGLDR